MPLVESTENQLSHPPRHNRRTDLIDSFTTRRVKGLRDFPLMPVFPYRRCTARGLVCRREFRYDRVPCYRAGGSFVAPSFDCKGRRVEFERQIIVEQRNDGYHDRISPWHRTANDLEVGNVVHRKRMRKERLGIIQHHLSQRCVLRRSNERR